MPGRIRRLLRTLPIGRVDLGDVPTLAAAPIVAVGGEGLSPSAALARGLLAEQLAAVTPSRCCVLGPGRLVRTETLPFACRMVALTATDDVSLNPVELDCLVVGDALAALDDPPAVLRRVVAAAADRPGLRLLVVLPGTALLPDDEAPCPRRWLFSAVSGAAMAREVLGERAGSVIVRGNVIAASSDLLGIAADRLWPDELLADDPEYPLVVALTTVP
jgi:hypothetical protein